MKNIPFTSLWLSDTIATVLFVTAGGTELEANPLMRTLIETCGLGWFVICKLAILALWLTLADKVHWGIHVALNAIMTVIVYMGLSLLFLF